MTAGIQQPSPQSVPQQAAPAPPATADGLLSRLRDAVPPPARAAHAATPLPEPPPDAQSGSGRWSRYRARQAVLAANRGRRRRRTRLWLLAAMALATLAATVHWPTLVGAYLDAYPAEAMKREALRACGAESPTFVRFLAVERESCYERMTARLAGAQAAANDLPH